MLNLQISQVTIKPQKTWLSKILPNVQELLETIPFNSLVSEEDELKLQQDFKEIMCELKTVEVENKQKEKSIINYKNVNSIPTYKKAFRFTIQMFMNQFFTDVTNATSASLVKLC